MFIFSINLKLPRKSAILTKIQNGGGGMLSTSLFTSDNHNKLKLGLNLPR